MPSVQASLFENVALGRFMEFPGAPPILVQLSWVFLLANIGEVEQAERKCVEVVLGDVVRSIVFICGCLDLRSRQIILLLEVRIASDTSNIRWQGHRNRVVMIFVVRGTRVEALSLPKAPSEHPALLSCLTRRQRTSSPVSSCCHRFVRHGR